MEVKVPQLVLMVVGLAGVGDSGALGVPVLQGVSEGVINDGVVTCPLVKVVVAEVDPMAMWFTFEFGSHFCQLFVGKKLAIGIIECVRH